MRSEDRTSQEVRSFLKRCSPCRGCGICYPDFLAAENGGNAVKRTPGLPPWTCWGTLDEGSSQGGNQESSLLLLSLPLLWRKCRIACGYRRVYGGAAGIGSSKPKAPSSRGAAPVRTLGLRGQAGSTDSASFPHPPSLRTGHPRLGMKANAHGRDGGCSKPKPPLCIG